MNLSLSIVLVTALLFLSIIMMVTITTAHQQAFALSKFFNCMTELANSHGKLTIVDVDSCYHKEFHQ